MTVRLVTAAESTEVLGFFEAIAPGSSQDMFGDADLWVVERDDERAVAMASLDLESLPAEVLDGADHIGLRIGTLEDDGFRMDLQAAVLFASVRRNQVVRVNEHAARLVLYGKDVLGESVLSYAPGLNAGDACILVNPRWEAIGIGEVLGRFKGSRPVVRPLHDLGAYLRDQD